MDSVEGADVTLSNRYATAGELVTITVKPNAGKQIDEVTVTNASGQMIPVSKVGDNQYTFTMPADKVHMKVTTKTAAYPSRIVLQINNKTLTANNKTIATDAAPVLVGNRTLLPVRVVTELLGGTVDWDGTTRTVIVTMDGKVFTMTIGKESPGFGTSATIINDRTYVPIRYVAEQLGANVEWIAASQQIIVEK